MFIPSDSCGVYWHVDIDAVEICEPHELLKSIPRVS